METNGKINAFGAIFEEGKKGFSSEINKNMDKDELNFTLFDMHRHDSNSVKLLKELGFMQADFQERVRNVWSTLTVNEVQGILLIAGIKPVEGSLSTYLKFDAITRGERQKIALSLIESSVKIQILARRFRQIKIYNKV